MAPLIFFVFGLVLGLVSGGCLLLGKLLGDWAGDLFKIDWLAKVLTVAGGIAGLFVQGGGAMLVQMPLSALQGMEIRNKGACAIAYVLGIVAAFAVVVHWIDLHF